MASNCCKMVLDLHPAAHLSGFKSQRLSLQELGMLVIEQRLVARRFLHNELCFGNPQWSLTTDPLFKALVKTLINVSTKPLLFDESDNVSDKLEGEDEGEVALVI